jgi:hypothetical protein
MAKVSVRFKKVKSGEFVEYDIAPILDQFLDMRFDDLQSWFYGFSERELKDWLDDLSELKQNGYVPKELKYYSKGNGRKNTHLDQWYIDTLTMFLAVTDNGRGVGRVYAPVKGFPFFTDVENNRAITKTSELMVFSHEYERDWSDTINQYVTIEDATLKYGGLGGTNMVFKNCTLNIVDSTDYNKGARLTSNAKFVNCRFVKDPTFRSSIKLNTNNERDTSPAHFGEVDGCSFTGFTFELPEGPGGGAKLVTGCEFNKCVFEKTNFDKTSDLMFVHCKLNGVTVKGIHTLLDNCTGTVEQSADWKDAKGVREFDLATPTLYVRGDTAPSITLNQNSFGARLVNLTKAPLKVKVEPRQTKYSKRGGWKTGYGEVPYTIVGVGNIELEGTLYGAVVPQLAQVNMGFAPRDVNCNIDTIARDYDKVENAHVNFIKKDGMFQLWNPVVDGNKFGHDGMFLNGDDVLPMIVSTFNSVCFGSFFKFFNKKLGGRAMAIAMYDKSLAVFIEVIKKSGLYSVKDAKQIQSRADRIANFIRLGGK